MATYGEYKIISDRSAADLQNNIAKATVKSINDYQKVQERDEKERRMFDIRQQKRKKEASENKALFEKNGKAIANGINDSFVEEYNGLLDQYNDYTNILENPNSNRKLRKEAMGKLSSLENEIAATKANQEIYIGGSANLEEKLSNSAALGSTYGFVSLNMGKDEDDNFIMNEDGGVAQDIANQLIGKPGTGDTFTRNTDGSIDATGTYLKANGEKESYTTKLTPQEVEAFLNKPTYNYIKPVATAINSVGNKFINENGALVEGFEETVTIKDKVTNKETTKPEEQTIVSTTVTGENGEYFERRETRTPVDQDTINAEIKTLAATQYVNFMANENNLARLQALKSIGLGQNQLDLLSDVNAKENAFKDVFEERMRERIGDGIMNTNPKANKGLFKDENGKWYFVEQVSKTEITKGDKNTTEVSDEFNTPEDETKKSN
tara:strand:+ start:164 stop:1474 length:1311 start_codon:yes stop_codon:yes gene_type:complete